MVRREGSGQEGGEGVRREERESGGKRRSQEGGNDVRRNLGRKGKRKRRMLEEDI